MCLVHWDPIDNGIVIIMHSSVKVPALLHSLRRNAAVPLYAARLGRLLGTAPPRNGGCVRNKTAVLSCTVWHTSAGMAW
jgi:hypothetical protein